MRGVVNHVEPGQVMYSGGNITHFMLYKCSIECSCITKPIDNNSNYSKYLFSYVKLNKQVNDPKAKIYFCTT